MKWFIDRRRGLFDRTFKILNGQEYFLHKLGAEELSTDPASLTLNGMLEIAKLDWSAELCGKIGLPLDKLPPVGTPARKVGKISAEAAKLTGFADGMPIAIGAGDQQCAAIGAGIVNEGMAEITIGTAMVMVAHIDSRKPDLKRQVLIGGSGIPKKDPETQPILMRLKSDLVTVMDAAVNGKLDQIEAEWDRRTALAVVLAAEGYPDAPKKGAVISTLPATADDLHVFHAGTARQDGQTVVSGGRVLAVTVLGDSVRMAQKRAYETVAGIHFDGMQFRRDIGWRALDRKK